MTITQIKKAIAMLRIMEVDITTIAIIQLVTGSYVINFGIPPVFSPNALDGKFLSEHSGNLGIKKIGSKRVKIIDSWTTTSVWI